MRFLLSSPSDLLYILTNSLCSWSSALISYSGILSQHTTYAANERHARASALSPLCGTSMGMVAVGALLHSTLSNKSPLQLHTSSVVRTQLLRDRRKKKPLFNDQRQKIAGKTEIEYKALNDAKKKHNSIEPPAHNPIAEISTKPVIYRYQTATFSRPPLLPLPTPSSPSLSLREKVSLTKPSS